MREFSVGKLIIREVRGCLMGITAACVGVNVNGGRWDVMGCLVSSKIRRQLPRTNHSPPRHWPRSAVSIDINLIRMGNESQLPATSTNDEKGDDKSARCISL